MHSPTVAANNGSRSGDTVTELSIGGTDHALRGVFRDNWVSTSAYLRGDTTHHASNYWFRKSATGGSGGTPGTTEADWARVVHDIAALSAFTPAIVGSDALALADNSDSNRMYEASASHLRAYMVSSPVHCPDPTGGTAGQVCAVNTGTDAYELVDQTGGGGTDDQTAAEVTVDATAFTGNLSATDTAVQTALDTIDGLSLGGTGTVSVVAFSAPMGECGRDNLRDSYPDPRSWHRDDQPRIFHCR